METVLGRRLPGPRDKQNTGMKLEVTKKTHYPWDTGTMYEGKGSLALEGHSEDKDIHGEG